MLIKLVKPIFRLFLRSFSSQISNLFKFLLIELLVFQPCFVAHAQNITSIDYLKPDGSTSTYTDRAINDVPIVNIAAPNSAGVSMNNWEKYNVTNQNQVINNYRGSTVDTYLASEIYGNPNFVPAGVNEARVIVNQVTSSNKSDIDGYIEIAGRKADLVIANPNGINIAGAGFINTGNLTLATGLVNLDAAGNVANIALSNDLSSAIIIKGVDTPTYINLGLDLTSVDYSSIIARTVSVLGDVQARNLAIKTGNKNYDYKSGAISSVESVSAAPIFALDSSYLGGIYANKITLIASEAGVGVRSRGDLVSRFEDIDLNVAGDVFVQSLDSNRDIKIESRGLINQGFYNANSALIFAKNKVNFLADLDITINGNDLLNSFYAKEIEVKSFEKITNNGNIFAENNLKFDSKNLDNNGLIFAGEIRLDIKNNFNNYRFGEVISKNNSLILANNYHGLGSISAGGNIDFDVQDSFLDESLIESDGNLSITARNGITYQDIFSGKDISIKNLSSNSITQKNSTQALGEILLENISDINLEGEYFSSLLSSNIKSSAGALKIKSHLIVGDELLTALGLIKSDLNIEAKNISNESIIISYGDIEISKFDKLVNKNLISADKKITINSANASFFNSGVIQALNDIDIKVNKFANRENLADSSVINPLIQSEMKLLINVNDNFVDDGFLKAGSDLKIDAKNGITLKNLLTFGNLRVTNSDSGSLIINKGNSYSALKSEFINNGGDINFIADENQSFVDENYNFAGGEFRIIASKNVVNNRNIKSLSDITINAASLENNMRIMALGNLNTRIDNDINNRGLIYAGNNINLSLGNNLLNDGGEIYAIKNININGIALNKINVNDFGILTLDKSSEIWQILIDAGYISLDGVILDDFKDLNDALALNVAAEFADYKDDIYKIVFANLNRLNISDIQSNVYKNLDAKAGDLMLLLKSSGYLDANNRLTKEFYRDSATDSGNINLGDDKNFANLKDIIYSLINDVNNGKIVENNFLDIITSGSTAGDSAIDDIEALIKELQDRNYISDDGEVSDSFNSLTSYNDLSLSSKFSGHKEAIFNRINEVKNSNKILNDNFSGRSFLAVNDIANSNELFLKLKETTSVMQTPDFTICFERLRFCFCKL